MDINLKNHLIQILIYLLIHHGTAYRKWTYELQELHTSCGDTDVCEVDLEVVRVSRGVFAVDGTFNIKIDVDDSTIVEGSLYRSKMGGKDFEKLPLEIANETLTKTMNEFYKKFIMDDIHDCAENAPFFETFTAPLTKRLIEVKHCKVSPDKLPSYMAEGDYRMLIRTFGQSSLNFDLYFKIEDE